jgi:hypothetical protein
MNKVEICWLRELWAIIFTPFLLILVKFTTDWRKSVRKRSTILRIVIKISLCVKRTRLGHSTPYPDTQSSASGPHNEIRVRATVQGCRDAVLRSLQKWNARSCHDIDRGCVLVCSVLCINRITGTRNGWCNRPNVTFAKLTRWFVKRSSVGCFWLDTTWSRGTRFISHSFKYKIILIFSITVCHVQVRYSGVKYRTLDSLVVAMCIARLSIKQFYVPLPTEYVRYVVWISEQSAISLTELSVFHNLGWVC